MAGMWLTIELILGMPPLTHYDRHTAPMYDLFQTEPILETQFKAIPSNVPYEENTEKDPMAEYCREQNWDVPDQVERIGEVVWAYMKPGVPYPHHLGLAPSAEEIEEEDEEEKGAGYRKMMNAYIEYAEANGMLDSRYSLVDKQQHQE